MAILSRLFGVIRIHWIEVALFLTALIVVSAYGITDLPIVKDMGFFSYIGQEMSRGYLPYSTVYEIKPPVLFYSYALAMNVFWFLPQYMSIRVFMLVMIAVSAVMFYRIMIDSTKDRLLAAITSLVYLSFNYAMELTLLGDSKSMALLFSFLTAIFAFRKNYVLSGAAAAVAFLFWQPFGVFLLLPVMMLVLEGDLRPLKLGRFIRVGIGFAMPLLVLIAYFYYIGSLSDLLNFSLLYPLKYEYNGVLSRNLWTVLKILGAYSTEFVYVVFGLAGLAYCSYAAHKGVLHGRLTFLQERKKIVSFAFTNAALALALMNYIDAQSQITVLLPALSALAAFMMIKASKALAGRASAMLNIPQHDVWRTTVALLLATVCIYGFLPALQPVYPENPLFVERNDYVGKSPYDLIAHLENEYGFVGSAMMFLFHRPGEPITLQQQLELAQTIRNSTAPDEKILSINAPELLFLSGRRNLNQYPLFEGVGFYELAQQRGELPKIVSDIVAYKPKFIIYTRDSFITKLGLDDFVKTYYVKSSFVNYNIYTLRA